MEDLNVVHNQPETCFEVIIDGRRSWLEYEPDGKSMVITHVVVHPELRGRGLAEKLMRTSLKYARENSLRVIPQCAYANAYMRRHREDADLLKR
jgi:hypothetical protein